MTNRFFTDVITAQQSRERARRELQAVASQVLSRSKRVIFKLQRGENTEAASDLKDIGGMIVAGKKIVGRDAALSHEGVWRAALEEATEAMLFERFLLKGSLDGLKLPTDDPEILVGGMSDFIGELARFAVLRATEGDDAAVERFYAMAESIIEALLQLDLTGGLRSKFDQAKQHLRKLEDIRYDMSERL
ncbi:MAG: hypothetical protein WC787_00050 [Patescibacteria group bacterium]|jgi:predicted translin family RNA/ssDNA-binding protein